MARKHKKSRRVRIGDALQLEKPAFVYPAFRRDVDHVTPDSENTTHIYLTKHAPEGTSEFTPIFAPLSGKVIKVYRMNPPGATESALSLLFTPSEWSPFADATNVADNQRREEDNLFSVTIASELPDGSVIFNEIYGLQAFGGKPLAKEGDSVKRGPSSVLGWRWMPQFPSASGAAATGAALPIGWRTRFMPAAKMTDLSLLEADKRAPVFEVADLASKMGGLFWIQDAKQNANLPPEEMPGNNGALSMPSAPAKKKSNTMLLLAAGAAAWFLLGKKGLKGLKF